MVTKKVTIILANYKTTNKRNKKLNKCFIRQLLSNFNAENFIVVFLTHVTCYIHIFILKYVSSTFLSHPRI